MSDEINKKLESKIDRQLIEKSHRGKILDGFKKNKTVNEVLDKPTIMTLYDMIRSNIISYVNGAVKAGKESVIFWAVNEEEQNVALKVYLISTSNFKNRTRYILGDPRFKRIRRGTRNLVYLWAKKEFRNLTECFEAKIPAPRPIKVSNNVLAMEFIGDGGMPAKTLLESDVNLTDYKSAISIIEKLYKDAKLVHADFSEYNIFKTKKGLIVFDLGSAVKLAHPNSSVFLKRDINNISNFFVKRGLTVENPFDVMERITK